MDAHPYGWLSLVPSLVAIVLAIATRRVVASLTIGIFTGAMITCQGDFVQAVKDLFELHLWTSLVEEDRLRVFAFTVLMGAMVGVIECAGGMNGLVRTVSRWAYNRRRGQLATWLLGMIVFFDDYANTVLLGNTLQPLCERLRISKEKLAYLVDSTAAPVAGLAIISTWVAVEIDFVRSGLEGIASDDPIDTSLAFTLFMRSIPYRFYVLWSLVFVFLIGTLQRDYGPMLAAEQKTLDTSETLTNQSAATRTTKISGWWNAVLPILATVVFVLWYLYTSGVANVESSLRETATLWQIFGGADSYSALLWGSLTGLVIAIVMAWTQRLLSWSEIEEATAYGAKLMVPALAVLWLASALSALTGHTPVAERPVKDTKAAYAAEDYRLYTGDFLAGLLADEKGETNTTLAQWLPTLVFVVSAGIAFATGASWGTMAIVMPVAIPLAYGALLGVNSTVDDWQSNPIVLATIGSVLAGAIFGDHCSPISDTTVLSSQACGCHHMAHVWTQLPYALTVGLVSIVCGTLPIGFGCPWMITMPAGVLAMLAALYLLGTPTGDIRDPND